MLSAASADSQLTPMSPEQLLAAASTARVAGLSGTITQNASLGLPSFLQSSDTPLLGLLSGRRSLRVWTAGESQQRVALVDTGGEYDVFHNGADVWQWDSEKQEATHTSVNPGTASGLPAGTSDPRELAQTLLDAVDATTTLTTGPQQKVAGRNAYQLMLKPGGSGSRISSVTVSIDGETHMPLGVQVYGPSHSDGPVVDVSFLDVSFAVPSASMFTFVPPASATVTEKKAASTSSATSGARTVGSGWTTVLALPSVSALGLSSGVSSLVSSLLPAVQGTWGSGHLINSKLMSALLTDDGRVFVGAVDPQILYTAAAR